MLCKMARAPCARRYNRRGTYRNLLVLNDRQATVHFFLLCFQRGCCGYCDCRCQKTAAGMICLVFTCLVYDV